jgi:hypothetical protein
MSSFSQPTPTHGQAPSHSPPDVHYAPGSKLAKFLGWFSLVLGAAELIAPAALARWTGVPHRTLIQAYGIREIVCGLGVLFVGRPVGWMWAHVAGDVLDLATLGYVLAIGQSTYQMGSVVAIFAVAGVTVLDLTAAFMLTAGKKLEG